MVFTNFNNCEIFPYTQKLFCSYLENHESSKPINCELFSFNMFLYFCVYPIVPLGHDF